MSSTDGFDTRFSTNILLLPLFPGVAGSLDYNSDGDLFPSFKVIGLTPDGDQREVMTIKTSQKEHKARTPYIPLYLT